MSKSQPASWLWIADVVGAALFAWGIADTMSAPVPGPKGVAPLSALAAIMIGGIWRAVAIAAAYRCAISGAQTEGVALRRWLFPRLLSATTMPSLGQSATMAIDNVVTLEDHAARFMPIRRAAAVAPLLVIGFVACASVVSAGILLATLVPFVVGMVLAGTAAGRASDRQIDALGRLSGLFVDRVRTLAIIRHFGAEDRIARQVSGAAHDLARRTLAVLRVAFLSSAVLEFFSALAVALVAVYCGFSLLGLLPFKPPETLDLRDAFFALAMAPEFYLPMRRLAAAYHEKQLGEAAQAAISSLPSAPEHPPVGACFGGLRAAGLVIAWPGCRIGPISFSIGKMGLLVVAGSTGSGKTSVLAAIAGQAAVDAGTLTGIDPAEIAWAAQRPLILPGSLSDNLALAAPGTDRAAIMAAAREVGLDALVVERSEGLDLTLDHRGSGLSGGERRRLGLGRALLAARPLLLADEPTADLDDVSAETIIALLVAQSRQRAVIVATHDARLIVAADAVVWL